MSPTTPAAAAPNINQLTFACGPHHRILKPGGWTTRKTSRGDTE